jgi:hypothetical protein
MADVKSDNIKQGKDITPEDRLLYEWIECTTMEEAARGESWFIRGVAIVYYGKE